MTTNKIEGDVPVTTEIEHIRVVFIEAWACLNYFDIKALATARNNGRHNPPDEKDLIALYLCGRVAHLPVTDPFEAWGAARALLINNDTQI